MTEIAGCSAVVTGGGSGLGRAIALELASAGAKVVVADIIEESAEATAARIRESGGAAIAAWCDVSDRQAVRALKAQANQAFGAIQIVIPNAGATSFKAMNGITDEEVDWIVEVNFMGVMNFVQVFLPDMIAAGEGHFVASASVAGLIPDLIEDHVPYSAAKAGVIGMMMNLRRELEGTGVQSTVFCVASVEGGMKHNNSRYRPERFGGPFEEEIVVPSSFKRVARQPEVVAPMVIQAIRTNRPMLVSDPIYRKAFIDRYVSVVLQAFDDVDEFFASKPEAR
jgi:NAD(P)-dependent dehydrogenase (short-subunit alcohol dehydrogenase family)